MKNHYKKIKELSIHIALAFTLIIILTGFDYTNNTIPVADIISGGVRKDAIPALTQPPTTHAANADYMRPNDKVIGVTSGALARAYPIRILNWHEIVNDSLGTKHIAVTFCPLCGTGMVFDATIKKKVMTFGVSGKLYNSDVLLYDHQTESLWSQIKMEAVTGKMSGTKLLLLASEITTWDAWKKKYPQTSVLTLNTGYSRNYNTNPYSGYEQRNELIFPLKNQDDRMHSKAWVIGTTIKGVSKAYPFSEIEKAGGKINDIIGKKKITVIHDKKTNTAKIVDSKGEIVPSIAAYWFAWYAFHPKADVYGIKKKEKRSQLSDWFKGS